MKVGQIIEIVRLIKQAGVLYDNAICECAQNCGISKQEADLLAFLANNPENGSAKELVRLRGCSKAYVSKAVDRLLERGYITASVHPNDRRRQRLAVAQPAQQTIQAIQKAQRVFAARLIEGVTAQERDVCWSVVRKISRNISEIK